MASNRVRVLNGADIIRTLRMAKEQPTPSMVRRLRNRIGGFFRRKTMATVGTTPPQAGEHGIKELDEFLDGFFELGAFASERLADGPDVGDALAFGRKILDKEFRRTLVDATKGADKIPAEVKDLNGVEVEYLVEKFKTTWLPKALSAFATIAAQRKEGES